MKAPRCVAVALAVLLASVTAGHAAARDDIADGAAGIVASAWDSVRAGTGGLWTAAGSLLATPDPFEYLPGQMPDRDRRFLPLMEAAGYRV